MRKTNVCRGLYKVSWVRVWNVLWVGAQEETAGVVRRKADDHGSPTPLTLLVFGFSSARRSPLVDASSIILLTIWYVRPVTIHKRRDSDGNIMPMTHEAVNQSSTVRVLCRYGIWFCVEQNYAAADKSTPNYGASIYAVMHWTGIRLHLWRLVIFWFTRWGQGRIDSSSSLVRSLCDAISNALA